MMQMYVGITDLKMFEFLKEKKFEEVNFWRPGNQPFRAIYENELFLFKLHAPQNYIVGGGFFVNYTCLPSHLVWEAFGEKNGMPSLTALNKALHRYRVKNRIPLDQNEISCIMLTDVFYFDEKDWIPVPEDFHMSTVQGKTYRPETTTGAILYEQLKERIPEKLEMHQHAMGPGAFQVKVTDAYKRQCAITGGRILPALEATHFMPPLENGPHAVDNGILLKSDLRALLDYGYLTIDKNYRVNVSSRLKEDYDDDSIFQTYHGQELKVLPDKFTEVPAKEFLEWHNENRFLG